MTRQLSHSSLSTLPMEASVFRMASAVSAVTPVTASRYSHPILSQQS